MQSLERMTHAALIAVVITLIVAGCGDEGAEQNRNPVADMPAASAGHVAVPSEKIATLEQDVVKLKTEVQQLRQRIEVDARMRLRHGAPSSQHQLDTRNPENLHGDGFRARHSVRRNGASATHDAAPGGGQDPAKMTPEQRRAWHEERRKMFDDPAKMTPEQRRAWHEENRRMREELSKMTPEQRRVWHEKRRRMREESRGREKASESGKQTSPDKEMQTSSDKQVKPKGESK